MALLIFCNVNASLKQGYTDDDEDGGNDDNKSTKHFVEYNMAVDKTIHTTF